MKKLMNIFTILTLFVLFGTSIISCTNSNGNTTASKAKTIKVEYPPLLERKTELGPDEELEALKTGYDNAIIAITNNPTSIENMLTLATIYITEARLTGNLTYYNSAAMQTLNTAIEQPNAPADLVFQALSYKSAVLLSMHQFQDALKIAQQAVAMNNKNAGIYGALIDASVELGNYKEAVAFCDNMLAIRPDLRSYSRASYIRQIYGDNQGAIDAMDMAVKAGYPGAENTEWARVVLGDLLLNIGEIETAQGLYQTALTNRPNYAYAEIGLAKVDIANKNYDSAIQHTENAIRIMGETAFIAQLADIYALKGDTKKATEIRKDVIDLLLDVEKEQNKNETIVKHNGYRELAMAYMHNNQLPKALENALIDLKMRPDNIDANELAAWIYFLNADYQNAKMHAEKMMATGTKNCNTLYKAGLIYQKAGDQTKANDYFALAKTTSPFIDQLLIEAQSKAL